MNIFRRIFLWAALFGAFCLLFYYFGKDASAPAPTADEGTLRLLTDGGTTTLSLREYLIGAVAGEMPVSFGSEALKAQAVAIRTYLLASGQHDDAQVCANSACCLAYADEPSLRERWGEAYEDNLAVIARAVDTTAGQYLIYGDEPIQAVFHASSGGSTEDSGALWEPLPYLISVTTPETADTVDGLISRVTVSPEELSAALGLDTDAPPQDWIQDLRLSDSGRVKGVLLAGKAFTGTWLRSIFSLRSTDFTLAWDGADFVFTVTGYGHGVGMSQYGAKLMAAEGYTYAEILAHYYPGTELAIQQNTGG